MGSIDKYIFRTTLTAFAVVMASLTGVIWITQALRGIDLMTSQGQTIVTFLGLTGLAVPVLVLVIAPIALEPPAQPLNINADTMAGEIARALGAAQLIFLTDVDGLLDDTGAVVDTLTAERAEALRTAGGGPYTGTFASGFNQLVNNAAKLRYRAGTCVPMTLRMPWGGLRRAGPYHSQDTSPWFFRSHGLKIVDRPLQNFLPLPDGRYLKIGAGKTAAEIAKQQRHLVPHVGEHRCDERCAETEPCQAGAGIWLR